MDIEAWLRGLGLGHYLPAFQENEVDAEILPKLTGDDLKDLGVVAVGHRRKLLEAIAALAEPASSQAEASVAVATRFSEAERRQLTVLFCDLVGSTALSAGLDPEDMRDVITTYQNCCAEVVRRFEGHVAKFMGDGVLAYFGYPQAHEDDAERAVRAGLELIDAVGRARAPGGDRLKTRVGIDTGLVVVGDLIGEGPAQEQAVVGDTPNLAARLQGIAEPNTVVISANTHRLAGGTFEYDDLGTQELKGVAEPLPAWRVIGEGRAESRFEAAQVASLTPFVGRDAEIAMLVERWQRAKGGEGQVVLLCGEPGIGKSRITESLRERVAAEPCARLGYQCSPHHINSALYPIIKHYEHAAGLTREQPGRIKVEKIEALIRLAGCDVATVAPLFAAMLSIDTADSYRPLDLSPQKQKQLTLQALVDHALTLAGAQPLVMIFEDAHWIDPTSQEVLDLLVPQIARHRILLVITHRPEYQTSWSALAHLTPLTLTRLGRQHAAAMVHQVTGGKSLPDEVLDQIVARTDGVPLFVEELTKTLLEGGKLKEVDGTYSLSGRLPDLAIPATLRDSLMARLDRLAAAKEVAQTGACIGREFSYGLIAAVSRSSAEVLDGLLAQLISSGLLLQTGVPPNAGYEFRHALVQNAAYESLLKSKRRTLHAEIARAWERDLDSSIESELDVLAEQFFKGAVWIKATEYYRRAAEVSRRAYAVKEALALYDEALAAGGHFDVDEAAEVLMAIHQSKSELYFTVGDFERSLAENTRMLEIARRVKDGDRESMALAGMAWAATWAENFPLALVHARKAIDVAEVVGCRSALGNAHMTTGYIHALSARLGPAVEQLAKALTICRSAGDVLRESLSLYMSGHIENWRGEFDRAVDLASAGAAVAREHDLVAAFLRSNYAQALSLTGRGDYDEALALLSDGLALAEKIGDEAFLPRYLNGLGWLHIECENVEHGIELSHKGAELARQRRHATGVEMACFAEVNMGDAFLAKGDLTLAHELLDKVHRTASNPATHEWMRWRYSTHLFASLGRLWLAKGHPGKAQEFADQCLKIAVPSGSRKYIASGWMLLGDAALARGDQESAEKWLRKALKLGRDIRHPPQLWRTHVALGRLYAETKRDQLAQQAHRGALSVVEQIKRDTTAPGLRDGLQGSPRLRHVLEQAAGG